MKDQLSNKEPELVKVCLYAPKKNRTEGPWVEVIKEDKEQNLILGRIDNELLFSDEHGLFYNDFVTFHLVDHRGAKFWEVSPHRKIKKDQ